MVHGTPSQDILNKRISPTPGQPLHRCEPPIPVWARLVWEHDGEERIETVAISWHGRIVRVQMRDDRWTPGQVYLNAEDVRRR